MVNDDFMRSMGETNADTQAFVDGLASRIAKEKERLEASLASGEVEPVGGRADLGAKLDDLQFEVSELRGMLESMRASLDSLTDSDHE
ncbi:MAG: hypothetical protein Q8K99_09035 [Actinomycetota bacterium]|nr:hypothetical protein [Actinomycetota bacterium]